MSDELGASVDNVERLLRSLPRREDRLHCLREYLFDHTPDEYRSELIVHFGAVADVGARPHRDPLRDALQALEDAATSDKDLRKLLTDLARVVLRPVPGEEDKPEVLPEDKPVFVAKSGKLHAGELPKTSRKR